jgi:hypothetical protein
MAGEGKTSGDGKTSPYGPSNGGNGSKGGHDFVKDPAGGGEKGKGFNFLTDPSGTGPKGTGNNFVDNPGGGEMTPKQKSGSYRNESSVPSGGTLPFVPGGGDPSAARKAPTGGFAVGTAPKGPDRKPFSVKSK